MSAAIRVAIGSALAVAALLMIGGLSQWTYTAGPSDRAELRLAWRALVPRVQECRRLTPEEQADLPVHMRREEICEGRVASYRLEVTVDGRTLRRSTIQGAGARGDRPLYVFESIPLRPGLHSVEITFERLRAVGTDSVATTVRPAGSTVPDRLALAETLELGPREVALVTYAPERRSLELLDTANRE